MVSVLKQYLEAGRIVKSHGVRGELCLEPWADSAEFLKKIKRFWFDEGKTDAGLISSRIHQDRLLLTLRGVGSVEQAEALRGKLLYLSREDAPLKPCRRRRQHREALWDPSGGASHRGQ